MLSKSLKNDLWSKFFNMSHSSGKGDIPQLYSIFHGEVASLQAYGAFVKIPGCKRQGLVHKSQMSIAHIEDPSEMLAKGENVYCKVIGFEGEGEKISLSMKVVNQTTGADLDPNNVQVDQDSKKRRQWKHIGKERIELGAELNTTCRRCGGHGHLTIDCFSGKDGTQYDLIPDLETLTALPPPSELSDRQHKKKKKKKEKKKKKKSKKKKRSSSSSSSSSSQHSDDDDDDDSEDDENNKKHSKHMKNSHKDHCRDSVRRKGRKSSVNRDRSKSSSRSPEQNVHFDRKSGKRHNSSFKSGPSSSPPYRHSKHSREDQDRLKRKTYDDVEDSSHSDSSSNHRQNSKNPIPQAHKRSGRRDPSPHRSGKSLGKVHSSDSDDMVYHKQSPKRSGSNRTYIRRESSPYRDCRPRSHDKGKSFSSKDSMQERKTSVDNSGKNSGRGSSPHRRHRSHDEEERDLRQHKETSRRKGHDRRDIRRDLSPCRRSRSRDGLLRSGSEESLHEKQIDRKQQDSRRDSHRVPSPGRRSRSHEQDYNSPSHKQAARKSAEQKRKSRQDSSPSHRPRSRSRSADREFKRKKKRRERSSS